MGHGARAPRPEEPGDARADAGSASASRCCARRASARARRSSTRTRRTRARSGKRTSSGSSCRWRIDPDGALGIRKHFESPYRARREAHGRRVLPLDLRERGAGPARGGRARRAWRRSSTCAGTARSWSRPTSSELQREARSRSPAARRPTPTTGRRAGGRQAGRRRLVDGEAVRGLRRRRRAGSRSTRARCATGAGPSRRCPATSAATSTGSNIDAARGEMLLLPTFRLPTLIHTRCGNAKWLNEISHRNPLWIHPERRASASAWRRATWCASRPRSATSSTASG